ncbi:MAG: hypothetical protein IJV85_00405 [Clostridia bacterium]|nr:hypothetical protein [Clostridia bacterium]
MEREEILEKSREENAGKFDERETAAFGLASRIGMLVGALLCVALILASEFLFHVPEIGLVGWLVYFTMQGSSNITLFVKLKNWKKFTYGIFELLIAVAFAVALIIKTLV